MKLEPTASQKLMMDDGAPSAAVELTPEERRQAWASRPSTAHYPAKEKTMKIETVASRPSKADQVASLRVARATRKGPPGAPASATPKTSKPPKARARAKKPAPEPKADKAGVRPGSKLEIVVGLLTRKEGCTSADILKATEWPAVSVPQQARAAGLTLRKKKEGRTTRYWGS